MAIASYIYQALARRDDVDLFTVGPYHGRNIPWGGGMQLPAKYDNKPDMVLPNQPKMPISFVEARLPVQPDLWIQVDAGFSLFGRPKHGEVIVIGTDPHVLNYDQQRKDADRFYCMQTPYMKAGDLYLPYAHDPHRWHYPEPDVEPQYDAALIGLHYENRNALVTELRKYGLKVLYDLGPCFDEARLAYASAPIGLNWSSRQDLTARVFELLGMARLAVVNDVPDLGRFFKDGQDLVTFKTLSEAVEKVLYYVERPEERQVIADQGHHTVQPHTWDNRIRRLLA